MKLNLLAIADFYGPPRFMEAGMALLQPWGVDVTVRFWEHRTLVELQEANLAIETGGPGAVTLPAALCEGLEAFDIVVTQFAPLDRRFIEAARRLKVIGTLRGGLENIDVGSATARGISVLNTPGRNARAVAECTIGLILAEVRNLARSHAKLMCGQWTRVFPNSDEIPELHGKTVGLVGFGAVARLVAGYLHAFGSRVLAYDPYVTGDTGRVRMVDLPTLMRESDIVSIHARLTPQTQHLIGAPQLALMKRSAVLINTARSGLVDEPALIQALAERRIMGAALDVFDVEPLPADHPLLKLDNVTVTPHLAGSSRDAFRNSPRLMAETILRLLRGERPLPVVNGIEPALGAMVP